jgi:hypothetical protein
MPAIIPQLFNSYVEIHTAQLGVLVGLFVGLFYREDPRVAYLLLFLSVVSALGNGSQIGFEAIDRKPWYFLTALYGSAVINLLFVKYGSPVWRRLPSLPRATRRNNGVPDDGG